MPTVKFYIDDVNQEYVVSGTAYNESTKQIVNVHYIGAYCELAALEFNSYSEENGFDCQRVIIRKV